MINPTEGNWKGKAGFFWAGTASLTALWAYLRLPELKGRSYEEADLMFHRGVSARKFGSYQIDAYEETPEALRGKEKIQGARRNFARV